MAKQTKRDIMLKFEPSQMNAFVNPRSIEHPLVSCWGHFDSKKGSNSEASAFLKPFVFHLPEWEIVMKA